MEPIFSYVCTILTTSLTASFTYTVAPIFWLTVLQKPLSLSRLVFNLFQQFCITFNCQVLSPSIVSCPLLFTYVNSKLIFEKFHSFFRSYPMSISYFTSLINSSLYSISTSPFQGYANIKPDYPK
jgi:hypothetical protein